MHIWVDADACPRAIKDVLFRAATRRQLPLTLVANQYLATPPSKWINALQVPQGFDVADHEILARLSAGDVVVTQDIPLADEVLTAGGYALNPRGTLYDEQNIKAHLARRDRAEMLRATGIQTGGPDALGKKDVQTFANALDRLLTKITG